MNKLIIKRQTESYSVLNMCLALEDEMIIPKVIMQITTPKIDGRQRRFLEALTISTIEDFDKEITFNFSAVINKKRYSYIRENISLFTTLKSKNKGKNINANVGFLSVNITGEYKGIYTVDISMQSCGHVSYD